MTINPSLCGAWLPCSPMGADVLFGLVPEYVAGGPRWLRDRCLALTEQTGCAFIGLDKPFGHPHHYTDGIPQYSFTMAAALRAASSDHKRIVNGWPGAMDDVVRAGVRVVPYLGAIQLSPELMALRPDQSDDALRMIAENIAPICEAGVREFYVDAAIDEWWVYHLLEYWRGRGLCPGYESNPTADQTHLHDKPVWVDDRTWEARKGMGQYQGFALTGGMVRFVPAPSGDGLSGEQWGAKWAAEAAPRVSAILADGHAPCVEALDLAMKWSPSSFGGVP